MLERLYNEMTGSDRAQMGGLNFSQVLIGIVIALTVAAVGVMILNSVFGTMALDQNDTLYNSSQEVINATEQAFSFLPIVIIVIMASVVILYLTMIRSRR